jgi:crossover junction endodeoxyribonuclease RuvC
MMYYIGVDPGKTGGIAIIRYAVREVIAITPMIIAGKDIDLSATVDWLDKYLGDHSVECYIEKVSAMPKQGVTSMFNFGFSTGAIHGIMAALNIPRHLVTPQQWKNVVLVNTKKDKDAAVDYCRRIWPDTSLMATERSRKAHSGMADALCIAKYGIYKDRNES